MRHQHGPNCEVCHTAWMVFVVLPLAAMFIGVPLFSLLPEAWLEGMFNVSGILVYVVIVGVLFVSIGRWLRHISR